MPPNPMKAGTDLLTAFHVIITLLGEFKGELGRVVYHVGSSHFFGIGIYPVSDIAGIGIFGWYCCTVHFGGNTFLSFCGNSFFEKFRGNSFFLQKEGEVYK